MAGLPLRQRTASRVNARALCVLCLVQHEQQDASEFLNFVVDGMHQELLLLRKTQGVTQLGAWGVLGRAARPVAAVLSRGCCSSAKSRVLVLSGW